MKTVFPIHKFRELPTPFYYYDTKVLRDTLACVNREVARYDNFSVHYAVKANANPKVLTIIRESGLGADCVSGGEIRAAIKAGFPAGKIVFPESVRLIGKSTWDSITIFSVSMSSRCLSWKSSTSWLPPKVKLPM